jgi:hypothetical protein
MDLHPIPLNFLIYEVYFILFFISVPSTPTEQEHKKKTTHCPCRWNCLFIKARLLPVSAAHTETRKTQREVREVSLPPFNRRLDRKLRWLYVRQSYFIMYVQ